MRSGGLELLTIGEVAKLFNVKESKLRRAILKKEIPYLKLGGLIRFKKSDLEEYLNGQRVLPRRRWKKKKEEKEYGIQSNETLDNHFRGGQFAQCEVELDEECHF